MRKTMYFIACICMTLLMSVTACKQTTEQTETPEQGLQPAAQQPTTRQAQGQQSGAQDPAYAGLGSIQIESMRDLWENSDALDIIFYETNFSLSQTEKAAIQNTLGYFLPSPVAHNANCKPVGRITFLVKGDIRQEADIYIAEGCQYFVWFKDNKPAYINPMTPEGVNFFAQIMKKGTSTFN